MELVEKIPLSEKPVSIETVELWSLVLQSVPLPHEVIAGPGGWLIFVENGTEEKARHQIEIFEEENRNWPPPAPSVESLGEDDWGAFAIMVALVFFFSVTGPWGEQNRWFTAGAIDSDKIRLLGEWWRLFTSLTLHADAAHLMGNVFLGGLLLYYLSNFIGTGAAWFSVMAGGGLGNALNVFTRHGQHVSIGFSTAVFAMAGIFAGIRWLDRGFKLQELVLPLGAAAALLAFLGSSGERTDLGAHFWGLVAGFLIGTLLRRESIRRILKRHSVQLVLMILAACVVYISWLQALAVFPLSGSL